MQGNCQRDAESQLQVTAGGDVGGNPFREVVQTDPQREQDGGTFNRAGNRLRSFAPDPADGRAEADDPDQSNPASR